LIPSKENSVILSWLRLLCQREKDETRLDFEARVRAMAPPGGLILYGGIPPMPGVSTIMTKGQSMSAAATYWGDDDEQERPPPAV
jgi:hypothetical protein